MELNRGNKFNKFDFSVKKISDHCRTMIVQYNHQLPESIDIQDQHDASASKTLSSYKTLTVVPLGTNSLIPLVSKKKNKWRSPDERNAKILSSD